MPSDDALAHSRALKRFIQARCADQTESMSFADYMNLALYAPGLGYYMAGAAKFGAQGDFVTSPELTPLFGATLANQALSALAVTGGGVLELGAGSGALAAGFLEALSQPIAYSILEPSAELQQRQRRLLQQRLSAAQYAAIRWIDQLPASFTGVVIANEVMDALPVERFKVIDGQLHQQYVSDDLEARFDVPRNALQLAVSAIERDLGREFAEDYSSEVCLLLEPWIASLADVLHTGVVLLADYGYPRQEYYSPERLEGTLSCYYRHRVHSDPFLWPGLQDITAHVDFTAVVEAGVANGLDLLGYASQSAFLLDNGLLALMEEQLQELSGEADRVALSKVVKTLTLPGEMGERFQVMALGKNFDEPLQGFQTQDLSYRL
ncbi:MAG: class I SAM-dependent methyltransferase [Granulosicoccus sp.]